LKNFFASLGKERGTSIAGGEFCQAAFLFTPQSAEYRIEEQGFRGKGKLNKFLIYIGGANISRRQGRHITLRSNI